MGKQSDYLEKLEQKMFQANQTSLELLRELKNNDTEIENLKNYIIDLKSKVAVYIPAKGDFIDETLAEYINNYPQR